MSQSPYQFPKTRFVSNTPWRQYRHLLSEVIELGLALMTGNLQHAAVETGDVKHVSETLHHILAGKGADVELAMETVEEKNRRRGYYQEAEEKA